MRQLIVASCFMLLAAMPTRADDALTLADLAWMEGHWVMENDEGRAEEIWMAPGGGSIVGSFRWVFPNGNLVTEYLIIEETEAGVTFRFKHFGSDFVPWEKDEPNTYRLTEASPGRAVFESTNWNGKVPKRMVYTRDGDTQTFTGTSPTQGESSESMILVFKRKN